MSDNFGSYENNDVTPQYYGEPQNTGGDSKGMAIASMILGIVSLVLSCVWYVSLITGIVSIVLAVMYNKKNGKCGMTTAGIVCSVIGMILAVVLIVLSVGLLAALGMSGIAELSELSGM
ncbi:MAG: DUF4190 domain-containing protein [Lachnospiraceae bacterium]|nr:DUF4190 domain-containing protein [Lachnospiraceae bacterium]